MKKKIILTLAFLLLVMFGWMAYKGIQKISKKETIEKAQGHLSKVLARLGRTDIAPDQSTVLIFFNSECEHCQWEMEEIGKNLSQFEGHRLLLTSFEPETEASAFLKKHHLSGCYLQSTPEKVMTAFTGGVPQTLIYNKGKLISHFKGEVKIAAILDALHQE